LTATLPLGGGTQSGHPDLTCSSQPRDGEAGDRITEQGLGDLG